MPADRQRVALSFMQQFHWDAHTLRRGHPVSCPLDGAPVDHGLSAPTCSLTPEKLRTEGSLKHKAGRGSRYALEVQGMCGLLLRRAEHSSSAALRAPLRHPGCLTLNLGTCPKRQPN